MQYSGMHQLYVSIYLKSRRINKVVHLTITVVNRVFDDEGRARGPDRLPPTVTVAKEENTVRSKKQASEYSSSSPCDVFTLVSHHSKWQMIFCVCLY